MSLIENIRRDLEHGTLEMIKEYRSVLLGEAYRMMSDRAEAEDLVFCTFEAALRNIDRFDEEKGSFSAWLKGILRRQYTLLTRGKVREGSMPMPVEEVESAAGCFDLSFERELLARSDSEVLHEAIAQMPETLREAMILHYVADMPVLKIAEFLKIQPSSVRARICRGRKLLVQVLGKKLGKPLAVLAAIFLAAGTIFGAWKTYDAYFNAKEETEVNALEQVEKTIVSAAVGAALTLGPASATLAEEAPAEPVVNHYRFISTQTSPNTNFLTPAYWEDVTGDGNPDVPTGDIETDEVSLVSGAGAFYSSIPSLRGMTFEPPMTRQFAFASYGANTLGAGGLTATQMGNPDANVYVYGYQKVHLACSQKWILDDGSTYGGTGFQAYQGISLPEDAVWTVCGSRRLYFNNASSADSLGKLRTNASISFYSNGLSNLPAGGLFWTNDKLEGYAPYTNAAGSPALNFSAPYPVDSTYKFPATEFQFTNSAAAFRSSKFKVTTTERNREIELGAWSGRIDRHSLTFELVSSGSYYNPFRTARFQLNDGGDLDSSSGAGVHLIAGIVELGHANALGVGNRVPVWFGYGQMDYTYNGGAAVGVLAKPGYTVGADFSVTNVDAYHQNGFQIYLGTLRAGAPVTYTGTICNDDSMLTPSLAYARCPSQYRLTAAKGGRVDFTGSLSGAKNLPYEVHGGGTIGLSGDNSALQSSLSIRSGTLVLGMAESAGPATKALKLGGTVPALEKVEYYSYVAPTFKKGEPLVVDGCTVQPGERVLQDNCVMKLSDDGASFAKDTSVVTSDYGLRVEVEKGDEFAGTSFVMVHSFNNSCEFTEEPTNPDVKVLAKDGVTVANAVDVTANRSTGVSAIGSAEAGEVTFAGAVNLAKDVFFEAAANSVVNVTGDVVEPAGATFNVGFSGLGTVVFDKSLSVDGRVLTVRVPTAELPASGTVKYILAKGLVGTPVELRVVMDDGSDPEEHPVSAKLTGGRLVLSVGKSGLLLILR